MCFPVNFAKNLGTPFFYRTPPVATSAITLAEICMKVYTKLSPDKPSRQSIENKF